MAHAMAGGHCAKAKGDGPHGLAANRKGQTLGAVCKHQGRSRGLATVLVMHPAAARPGTPTYHTPQA